MVDPRIALAINAAYLRWLLPNVQPEQVSDVRREFARYLHSPAGRTHETWQSAWNAWTGAETSGRGHLAYVTARCARCLGTGSTAGTGQRGAVCGNCRGSGSGQPVEYVALYAS